MLLPAVNSLVRLQCTSVPRAARAIGHIWNSAVKTCESLCENCLVQKATSHSVSKELVKS